MHKFFHATYTKYTQIIKNHPTSFQCMLFYKQNHATYTKQIFLHIFANEPNHDLDHTGGDLPWWLMRIAIFARLIRRNDSWFNESRIDLKSLILGELMIHFLYESIILRLRDIKVFTQHICIFALRLGDIQFFTQSICIFPLRLILFSSS